MKLNWLSYPAPLRVSIPLLVLVFNLCFLCVTSYLLHLREQDREIARALYSTRNMAVNLAAADMQSTVEKVSAIQNKIDLLTKDNWVLWVAVCSAEGKITFSTKPDQIGQPIKSVSPDRVAEVVSSALKDKSPKSFALDHISTFAIQPALVTSEGQARWFAIVERDLQKPLNLAIANTLSDTLLASFLLLLFSVGLWGVLHRILTRRVHQLLLNAQRITRNTLKYAPLTGSDEFAQISKSLWESENRFRQIAENIPEAIYITAVDEPKMLYVSPAYEEIWGLKISNLMKNPIDWVKVVLAEDLHLILTLHDHFNDGRTINKCEYRIRHADGSIRWLETVAFPVRNEKNEIYRIVGQTTNISDRKELEQEILNISEKESRRIGYDLHDDLGQRLAAIKLRCEYFVSMIENKEPPSVDQARDICSQIAEATILCRNIARGLSPVDLEEDGLMLSLEKLITLLESRYEIPIFFHCPTPVLVENEATSTHLYRVAQEFINNAARHGVSSRIDVRLSVTDMHLHLEVLNDGIPFQKDIASSSGMGLKFASYRASSIGASITINPRVDGITGTQALCLTPVSACKKSKINQPSTAL